MKRKPQAPRIRPFSWWSIDIAEDLGLIERLTTEDESPAGKRARRDAFAELIWTHLEEHDPAHVEAEVKAGRVPDHARDFKQRPEAILSIPRLPKILADFETLLKDRRIAEMIGTGGDAGEEDLESSSSSGE